MGSSAVLGLSRAPHRAPTIWEGWVEYNEEREKIRVCLICKEETCPGAVGRVCIYELEFCSTCNDRNCVSNLGHDCPWDDRCRNCGHLDHPFWHDPFTNTYPTCDMPSMELCGDCGSATCKINPPQPSTPRIDTDSWYPDGYLDDLYDDFGAWDPDPVLTIAEEIEACWVLHSTQITARRVELQAEAAWDRRLMDEQESELRRSDRHIISDSYQLYELEDDWGANNISDAFVLNQLRQHPNARPLHI